MKVSWEQQNVQTQRLVSVFVRSLWCKLRLRESVTAWVLLQYREQTLIGWQPTHKGLARWILDLIIWNFFTKKLYNKCIKYKISYYIKALVFNIEVALLFINKSAFHNYKKKPLTSDDYSILLKISYVKKTSSISLTVQHIFLHSALQDWGISWAFSVIMWILLRFLHSFHRVYMWKFRNKLNKNLWNVTTKSHYGRCNINTTNMNSNTLNFGGPVCKRCYQMYFLGVCRKGIGFLLLVLLGEAYTNENRLCKQFSSVVMCLFWCLYKETINNWF